MIPLNEYLKNPCGTLSIPYWKNKNIITPEHIKVVHQIDYSAEDFSAAPSCLLCLPVTLKSLCRAQII